MDYKTMYETEIECLFCATRVEEWSIVWGANIKLIAVYFLRILKMLNMQQFGRNYYSPSDPLNIPQHRYI